MKKGFALLLAMALMLTGCGSSSVSTGTPVPAETAKETVKETQTEAAGTEGVGTEAVDLKQTEDGTESAANAAGTETESSSDTLVIYFSRTGEQYVVGEIDKGNTAIVAEMIADQTGAELFEVLPEDDHYPMTYDALTGQSYVAAAVFGGGRHNWHLQQKCSLKKTDGVWKITRSVASTY